MHQLDRPDQEPEPVVFKSGGTLYAHGLLGHVRAGQNPALYFSTQAPFAAAEPSPFGLSPS